MPEWVLDVDTSYRLKVTERDPKVANTLVISFIEKMDRVGLLVDNVRVYYDETDLEEKGEKEA